jgi:two-component system copper resistance phosphate regulon response regulator CusR
MGLGLVVTVRHRAIREEAALVELDGVAGREQAEAERHGDGKDCDATSQRGGADRYHLMGASPSQPRTPRYLHVIRCGSRNSVRYARAMHLVLVDDDPKLRRTLQQGFEDLGHSCETFEAAEPALLRLRDPDAERPDVVLLDVMLPGIDGWEMLQRLRDGGEPVPVLYLTARQGIDERVRGLELGADDYVVKPFEFPELLARVQAVLRRRSGRAPIIVGPLVLDLDGRRAHVAGRRLELGDKEFRLLVTLASEPGRVFDRPELLRRVWELEFDPGTNVVDVLVARLRRKLTPHQGIIQTVAGRGYRIGEGSH